MSFDYGYLTKLLHESGFNEVERYDWKEFLSEGYDDYSRAYLPHMDFEKGRAMSLNLIAKKIL